MKKIAIVTGCSKGIGKEIALELARDGYDIIGTYNTSNIENLKNRIEAIGINFYSYKLDLLNEEEVFNFCKEINKKFKNIDILVNNAALSLDCEFLCKKSEEFRDVLQVNLVSPFLLIQNLNIDNGVIINISSTDGINTYSKLNIDYSASKAGLINMTKSLSLILSSRIYAICPNWVNTESIREMDQEYLNAELRRIGQKELIDPKDIAKKVIKLIESNMKSGSIVVMEDKYE